MSTAPTLRPYQARDLDRIRDSYRQGHRAPLYQAPCGSGKTVLFAHICAGAAEKGTQVLILAHRSELVDQISTALSQEGCTHGFIAAGYPWRVGLPVYVASVFTVAKRLDCFRPDLIVVDEAHHAIGRTTWGRVLKAYPQARVLGVTATPQRLSGEGLDEFFDTLIVGPTHEELIQQGYLSPVRVYAPPTIDTEGLHSRYGEYVQSEVLERVDRPTVTGDCIAHYRRHTPGARAIVFDVSVEAAQRRAQAFQGAGFRAACIDGTLARDVRALAIAEFRVGRLQVLTSCELVSEGFDLPAIEVGIGLRPTRSLALWLQQSGRVLRPFPGKETAVFFDHTGNVYRHGLPTEVRAWSLARLDTLSDGSQRRAGLRTCPACFAVSPPHAVVCRACGRTFPVEPRRVSEVEGELGEVTAEALIRARHRQEQGQAQTLEALIQLGRTRRMRYPERWAAYVLAGRKKKQRLKGSRL